MSVIYSDIKKVILYGLEKKLLHEADIPYAVNTILNLLGVMTMVQAVHQKL